MVGHARKAGQASCVSQKAYPRLGEGKQPATAILAPPGSQRGAARLFRGYHERFQFIKEGLYQYSIFKQADILTASGVGGGSLIYSNVTLRPHPEILQGIGLNFGDPEYKAALDWMEGFR